jgi:hypothetical protein
VSRSRMRMRPGADVVACPRPRRSTVSCKQQQVVAFVDGEPEAAGERADHLLGGLGAGAPFEAGEVVGGHVRQVGYFLPAKARGSAAWAAAQADIFRLERFAAGPNERS